MTETLNWQALTELQRDALIHEQVMGHYPDEPCTGRFIPLDPEPDGLGCATCGAEIGWGDLKDADELHEHPRPPHYTTSMDAAWLIADRFDVIDLLRIEKSNYRVNLCKGNISAPGMAATAQEAICIAALYAIGCEVQL